MLIAAAAVVAVSLMLALPRVSWLRERLSRQATKEIEERLRQVTGS